MSASEEEREEDEGAAGVPLWITRNPVTPLGATLVTLLSVEGRALFARPAGV